MKRMLIAALLSLAICGSAIAADYIRIDVDTVYKNETTDWEFYLLRECPVPEKIAACKNAFELTAVGNATWSFSYPDGFQPFPDHLSVWNLGGLLFVGDMAGTDMTAGWFHVSGVGSPPEGGMPVYSTEQFWFSLTMTIGDLPPGSTGDGILIDSAWYVGSP
jgi:opacity protein-like surface antigen